MHFYNLQVDQGRHSPLRLHSRGAEFSRPVEAFRQSLKGYYIFIFFGGGVFENNYYIC